MRIVFLGTGGYHPNERRHTAGLFVPELGLLLDAGTGTFRMTNFLIHDHLRLFLTHAHLDHVCGLTYLLVPLIQQQLRQIEVIGTQETLEAVQSHLFAERIFPVLPRCEFHRLEEQTEYLFEPGFRLTYAPLKSHPGGSIAYRLDDRTSGGSFAYVTDTAVDGSYLEFLDQVELLIHECYFPDSMQAQAARTGHAYTTQVARLAREIGAKRLLLTHFDPSRPDDDPIDLKKARQIFPKTDLAEDLMEILVERS